MNIFKFYASDPTPTGFINFNKFTELAALAKNADFQFDAKKFCKNIFPDIDTNKDGHIDFKEFFKLCEILPGVWRKGFILSAFICEQFAFINFFL